MVWVDSPGQRLCGYGNLKILFLTIVSFTHLVAYVELLCARRRIDAAESRSDIYASAAAWRLVLREKALGVPLREVVLSLL